MEESGENERNKNERIMTIRKQKSFHEESWKNKK